MCYYSLKKTLGNQLRKKFTTPLHDMCINLPSFEHNLQCLQTRLTLCGCSSVVILSVYIFIADNNPTSSADDELNLDWHILPAEGDSAEDNSEDLYSGNYI